MDPAWHQWGLGTFHGPGCGGHWYMHSTYQLTDMRRKGEKGFHATGHWQVLHHHELGRQCTQECEVYGVERRIPRAV